MEGQDNNYNINYAPTAGYDGPPEAKRPASDNTFTDVNGAQMTTEEYPVPDNMVGLIIGRGGDQITKIQADTGCRVAVVPQPTGSVTRPCTLTGTPEQIAGNPPDALVLTQISHYYDQGTNICLSLSFSPHERDKRAHTHMHTQN